METHKLPFKAVLFVISVITILIAVTDKTRADFENVVENMVLPSQN